MTTASTASTAPPTAAASGASTDLASAPAPSSASAPLGVAARLRAATATEHRAAEGRSFMTELMGGELDLPAYALYLAQFARVYEAMEARPVVAADPELLHDRAVHRAASARADLVALGAADWRVALPALPATESYAAHVGSFGPEDGLLHLAHHYTRYLGDLSGGQVMATMLRRHYGATDEQLGFFRFDGIANLVHYKRAYRERLDALALDEEHMAILLGEARRAFEFSSGIFDALADARTGAR